MATSIGVELRAFVRGRTLCRHNLELNKTRLRARKFQTVQIAKDFPWRSLAQNCFGESERREQAQIGIEQIRFRASSNTNAT